MDLRKIINLKMYAGEKELPDPTQMPSVAGKVIGKTQSGIVNEPYRSPFRS